MDSRLIVLALGSFTGSMESFVLPGLLPAISHEMQISVAQAGYLIFAYSITYAIAAPLLSSIFGTADRRRILALAELTFGVCALLMVLAPFFSLIVVARSILACAAVLFTTMAQATAYALSPPDRKGRGVSIVLTGGTLAVAVGAPLGALIGVHFGWRVTYTIVALLALSVATIMWLRLPQGIVGERRSLAERLAVLGNRGVPAALTMSLLFMIGAFGATIYVAAITTQAMKMGAETIPFMLLVNGIGAVAGGVIGGQLTDRLGPFRTFVLFAVGMTALLTGVSALPLFPPIAIMPAWLLLFGLMGLAGWGLFAAQVAMLASLAPQAVPLAVSLNLSAVNIGAALAALLGGLTLEHLGADRIGIVSALFTLAALGVAIANRRGLQPGR